MLNIIKGDHGPYGVINTKAGIQFCFSCCFKDSIFLCIYNKNNKLLHKIDLLPYRISGAVYSVIVNGIDINNILYDYLADEKHISDPFMKNCENKHKWGEVYSDVTRNKAVPYTNGYDWGEDSPLHIPYKDVIAYSLHVRGFTKHSSSKVLHRGTYSGIIEKIPYLNQLGINQIIIMPTYDFEETDVISNPYIDEENEKASLKINFWGFKKGNYYIPKPEYSYANDFIFEFKEMVKQLHSSGIEIVMKMYFPKSVNKIIINDILAYWVSEYHVDGFHIMADDIDFEMISSEPLLADTKLYYQNINTVNKAVFSDDLISVPSFEKVSYVNSLCCEMNDDYKNQVRSYLKSDEDSLQAFTFMQRRHPDNCNVANYLSSYDGFTLYDSVSYDYKHNEDNGEDNRDGSNYNHSWNCGVEGITKKQSVNLLRLKQLKNAFTFLLTASSVPVILAGDEFMNSQKGNNNAYCQDNEIGWINWNNSKAALELKSYVSDLIKFRKNTELYQRDTELLQSDIDGFGYPELSYHCEQAWFAKFTGYSRNIGIMIASVKSNEFIYFAYNMHWNPHLFGLPYLPKGMYWDCLMCSDVINESDLTTNLDAIEVPARTSLILIGKKIDKNK